MRIDNDINNTAFKANVNLSIPKKMLKEFRTNNEVNLLEEFYRSAPQLKLIADDTVTFSISRERPCRAYTKSTSPVIVAIRDIGEGKKVCKYIFITNDYVVNCAKELLERVDKAAKEIDSSIQNSSFKQEIQVIKNDPNLLKLLNKFNQLGYPGESIMGELIRNKVPVKDIKAILKDLSID